MVSARRTNDDRFRLAIVATHPIQYLVPLYRELAQRPELAVRVFFFTAFAQLASLDPGFGLSYAWDVDLTSGYDSTFVANEASTPSPRFFGSNCPSLLELIQRNQVDGLLLPGYKARGYLQAWRAARRQSIPVLLRGESCDHRHRSTVSAVVRDGVLRQFYGTVGAFLAIGARSTEHFRRLGVNEQRIFRSPYGIDEDRFTETVETLRPRREQIRREFGIPDGAFVITIPGKLIPRKAPLDALVAASRCHQLRPFLLFTGDGPLRSDLVRAALNAGYSDYRITGFLNQSHIVKSYVAADALLLPSHWETWGIVVNEAMVCGLPAVVSDQVGCAPDLVQHGRTGYVYKAGDTGALAGVIQQLAQNREQTRTLGYAARKHVLERYSTATAADGVICACQFLST